MITPSHVILNGGIARFSKFKKYAWWSALGGFLPDIPIYFFTIITLILRIDMGYVWDILYFSDNLQMIFNLSHSFVVWGVLIAISFLTKKGWFKTLTISSFFHVLTDFFVHASDAYAQFYPISNWRFYSPVSYYEREFFGREFSIIETMLCLVFAYLLFRNSKRKIARRSLIALMLLFVIFLGLNISQFFR